MRRFTLQGADETATFKVYDASTGVTYDTIDLSVVIKPEGEVGSFGEPLLIKVVGGEPTDTTAPVITLTGSAAVSVEVGGVIHRSGCNIRWRGNCYNERDSGCEYGWCLYRDIQCK